LRKEKVFFMDPINQEPPFFSVIVAVTDHNAHLLPLTLDSIAHQTYGSLEIILVDSRSDRNDGCAFSRTKVCISSESSIYSLFNQGLALSKGKFIHFLSPGEFYITPKALYFIREFLLAHREPDLVYTGYILRHSLAPPQNFFQVIGKEELKAGWLCFGLQPYWFKKEALQAVGNFNTRYESEAGFDLICRFFLEESLKKILLKRVLTDYQYQTAAPKKIIGQLLERIQSLFSDFGVNRVIFGYLASNQLRFVRWGMQNAKAAIWKRSAT
jgi:glycosyltransferase involved in cell wall biosynthesis